MLVAGCSSSYTVSSSPGENSISEFNRFAYGKQGMITFERDTVDLWAAGLRAKPDSLFWFDEAGLGKSAASRQIKEVTFTNATRGTWEGVGLGFLSGAGAAALVTAIIIGGRSGESGILYILTLPGGAIVGTVVGAIIGGSTGHTYRYTFH